jgi:hypothetical protein
MSECGSIEISAFFHAKNERSDEIPNHGPAHGKHPMDGMHVAWQRRLRRQIGDEESNRQPGHRLKRRSLRVRTMSGHSFSNFTETPDDNYYVNIVDVDGGGNHVLTAW